MLLNLSSHAFTSVHANFLLLFKYSLLKRDAVISGTLQNKNLWTKNVAFGKPGLKLLFSTKQVQHFQLKPIFGFKEQKFSISCIFRQFSQIACRRRQTLEGRYPLSKESWILTKVHKKLFKEQTLHKFWQNCEITDVHLQQCGFQPSLSSFFL